MVSTTPYSHNADLDKVLHKNAEYVKEFSQTEKGKLPLPPRSHILWITCMDPRLDPAKMLGLEEGDAAVIRNGGGRFADAERSIVIAQAFGTREVAFIHHTDCGMLRFTDQSIRQKMKNEFHIDTSQIDSFLPFTDVQESIRDDLEAYKKSPNVLQNIPVRGFIYDTQTGKLEQVAQA